MWNMQTEEQAQNAFQLLKASPEFARVIDDDRVLLHPACFNHRPSTLAIIQYLVHLFPKALEKGDVDGDLPLHLACLCDACSPEAVRYLVQKNPEAIKQKNALDELPLHLACEKGGSLQVVRYLLEQYPNALEQKNYCGMMPLHSCIWCFKARRIDFPNLLDRMRLVLPGYPKAIDISPHYEEDVASLWPRQEEHELYKEVSGLLLEEISIRDLLEWAGQVEDGLACLEPSFAVELVRLWATDGLDDRRVRLETIEARLVDLDILVEEFRGE